MWWKGDVDAHLRIYSSGHYVIVVSRVEGGTFYVTGFCGIQGLRKENNRGNFSVNSAMDEICRGCVGEILIRSFSLMRRRL